MPSQTFNNLPEIKRQRITKALFNEFSHHSLPTARVSRIVTNAKISRGAFYKYFANIKDAYLYLCSRVLKQIHHPLIPGQDQDAAHYMKMTKSFLDDVESHPYRELVKRHLQTNQRLLGEQGLETPPLGQDKLTIKQWMAMVLVHQTLLECLNQPADEQSLLERLNEALQITLGR